MSKKAKQRRKELKAKRKAAAKRNREVELNVLSDSGMIVEEKTGGAYHQSPRKVDSTGVPIYGRSLISPKVMEILKKQGKLPVL